jgi:hypothetical protein
VLPCPGLRATIATLVVLGTVGCDGLRPSTFTAGWSDPAPIGSDSVTDDSAGLDAGSEAAEPEQDDQEASRLQEFDDWRLRHDSSAPCPSEMVPIKDFCIDRWEGSLVEVTTDGLKPFSSTQRPGVSHVRAISRPNVMPQGYISGAEAQRACEMAGKRLCTDGEWFRACEGPKGTIFPYGTVLDKQTCNGDRKLHPVQQLYGEDAGKEIWMVEPMNNPAINEQPDTVSPTASRSRCVGPYGLFDMVGNLQEWTSDPAGTFRGGAYSTNNALGCQYSTTVHGFGYHDYSLGFRCCSEPYTP